MMRLLILILLALALLTPPAIGKIVSVCNDGCDYARMRDAIGASEEGDIVAAEGEFRESLHIAKPITIEGNATIYHGMGPAIEISADGVVVRGLTFAGGYAGIVVRDARGVRIEGCRFLYQFRGIEASWGSDVHIEGNEFESIADTAIWLKHVASVEIEQNSFMNATTGLYLGRSSGNNVRGNSFYGYFHGVILEFANANLLEGNEFTRPYHEEVPAAPVAIRLQESSENIVRRNRVEGGNSFWLERSYGNEILMANASISEAGTMDSEGNDFVFTHVNLTGKNILISIGNPALPEGYVGLSEAVKITVVPDLLTGEGYFSMETSLDEMEMQGAGKELEWSSIAFYRRDGAMTRVSKEIDANGRAAFATSESGIYILAGTKKSGMPFELRWVLSVGAMAVLMILAFLVSRRVRGTSAR
ncbi:MAG: right-handed parallel beta-helix repeat-containing protein [Methanomicrobiales archaeon]|nr:right-handed parallel beta-helix repeat-containing protein [Methanomicrobiales archaeon]